jgi:hypothetical protein
MKWPEQHRRSGLASSVVCSLLLLLGVDCAFAGLRGPTHTWTLASPDGKHLLVIISELPIDEDAGDGGRGKSDPEYIRSIRAKYPQSGLYLNDGSTEPLWIMREGWGRGSEFHIAPDGQHFVVAGGEDCFYTDFFAMFYRNGQKVKFCRTSELVPFWRQGIANLCRRPIEVRTSYFDGNALTYEVTTTEGEQFVFDITTGQLIRHTSHLQHFLAVLLLVITVPIGGGAWWWYRRACQRAAELTRSSS